MMDKRTLGALQPWGLDIVNEELCRVTQNGSRPVANFHAWVVEELIHTDGESEDYRHVAVEGRMSSGRRLDKVVVPARSFSDLRWVAELWGLEPIMEKPTDMRRALQVTASFAPTRVIRTHTGWAEDVFLTATSDDVELPSQLVGYRLPEEPGDVREPMRASLALLDVASLSVTFPLWAVQFLAPLCPWLPNDFTLWVQGETGTLKSTLAALFLCHFGDFHLHNLPEAWSSTPNALEAVAFHAKDVPLVIDDYSSKDLQRKAERVLRGQGNRAGRSRLGAGLELATTYAPRGIIISTGEDLPQGQSLLARTLVVHVERGAVDLPAVDGAQARRHLFPYAMAGYVSWLADRRGRLQEELTAMKVAARTEAQGSGDHLRQPELLASIRVAGELALNFAVEVGSLTRAEANALLEKSWEALLEAGRNQARLVEEQRPSTIFLRGLLDLLAANQGRISGLLGQLEGVRDFEAPPAGRLGWVDAEYIYLLGTVAYATVGKAVGKLPVTEIVLWKELAGRGILERPGRGRLATHMTIAGTGHYVYRLSRAKIEEACS